MPGNESAYLDRVPGDKCAVVADAKSFGLAGDGKTDDAAGLQRAIDEAAGADRFGGIVFLPPGEYRLESTLNLWAGVRIISVGDKRPVLRLRAGTPSFQGTERRYLVHFRHWVMMPDEDANNSTFFSGIMGVDFAIDKGYPNVAAVRYRVAQHSLLRQCDFYLSEDTYAGIDQAGHIVEECGFLGGNYGISSLRTSASWPLCVRRCRFEGQKKAAMATSEAGLTVIETRVQTTPVAFSPAPEAPADIERLHVRSCLFDDVDTLISRASACAAEQQLSVINCQTRNCRNLAVFESSVKVPLKVKDCIAGWYAGAIIKPEAQHGGVEATGCYQPPPPTWSPAEVGVDIQQEDANQLPPASTWVNALDYGVKGDGTTDDGPALQRVLDGHSVVYLPQGNYLSRQPLYVSDGHNLVGLHPGQTQIELPEQLAGFTDQQSPRALIETGKGGKLQLRGIGLRLRNNPGASGISWRAGPDSLLEDIYFHAPFRTRDIEHERCFHSIWVRDSGAGKLRNIWSADVAAESGLRVEETKGPLECLMLSIEHHREQEVWLSKAQNVSFIALQTEENSVSPNAIAIRMREANRIEFSNTYLYRALSHRQTVSHAVECQKSGNISFYNVHVFSWGPFPFANALLDQDRELWVRQREFVRLVLPPSSEMETS